jgi:hypothetical protein
MQLDRRGLDYGGDIGKKRSWTQMAASNEDQYDVALDPEFLKQMDVFNAVAEMESGIRQAKSQLRVKSPPKSNRPAAAAAAASKSPRRRLPPIVEAPPYVEDPNLAYAAGDPTESNLSYGRAAAAYQQNPITGRPFDPFPHVGGPLFDPKGYLILATVGGNLPQLGFNEHGDKLYLRDANGIGQHVVLAFNPIRNWLESATDKFGRIPIGATADRTPITEDQYGTRYYWNTNNPFAAAASSSSAAAAASGRRRSPKSMAAAAKAAEKAADMARKLAESICPEDTPWPGQEWTNQDENPEEAKASLLKLLEIAAVNDEKYLAKAKTTHDGILANKNIPENRKNGLFALKAFKKHEVLAKYGGKRITFLDFDQLYPENARAEYGFELGCRKGQMRMFIDDNPPMYLPRKDNRPPNKIPLIDARAKTYSTKARYANDARGATNVQNNAKFHGIDDQLFLIADRYIKKGEEIFADYGEEYWQTDEEVRRAKSTSNRRRTKALTSPVRPPSLSSIRPPSLSPMRPPPTPVPPPPPTVPHRRVKHTRKFLAAAELHRIKVRAAKTTKILNEDKLFAALQAFFQSRRFSPITAAQIAAGIEKQFLLPNGGRPHKLQDRIRSVLDALLFDNRGNIMRFPGPKRTSPYLYLWNGVV